MSEKIISVAGDALAIGCVLGVKVTLALGWLQLLLARIA